MHVQYNTSLVFHNFDIINLHSSQDAEAKSLPVKPRALAIWPTITLEDATMVRVMVMVCDGGWVF